MAAKLKAHKLGTEPYVNEPYEVVGRRTLNCTKIDSNNNKYWSAEFWQLKNGKTKLFTEYGRVGAQNPAREIRMCDSQYHAEQVLETLIKSKTKKGYVEVKLLKADVGSDKGKSQLQKDQVSVDSLKKAGVKIKESEPSKLHSEVQDLVRTWFGSTAKFVESNLDTKKCPLGQLSLDQVTKGKDILDESRKIVHGKSRDKTTELNKLTSMYYSNIPHVLPHRINADILRFDDDAKIDKAMDILDVFQDAKNVQKLLTVKSNIDSQYSTLNAELEYLDPSTPT